MQITQLDDKTPVSSTIYGGHRKKYLNFKHLNIVDDDGTREALVDPPLYINQQYIQYHKRCVDMIEPTNLTLKHIEEHKHLLDGVSIGVAIRLGVEGYYTVCDDTGKKTFEDIIENAQGNVFVACDVLDYKLELERKFGEKVRFLRNETVISRTTNVDDRPDPYIEFFLLSMCPKVYITGGPRNFTVLSTFGYIAALYGQKPFDIVWNAT